METYLEFLRSKIVLAKESGFELDPGEVNPGLKPHQRDAVVWDDINRMKTLNTTQSQRRQQMHVCPLQLDIVDRLINRYSNPGDLVLDPFGGLGTVALEAMKAGRRGYTIELNDGYFRDAVGYLKEYEEEDRNISLFDLIG